MEIPVDIGQTFLASKNDRIKEINIKSVAEDSDHSRHFEVVQSPIGVLPVLEMPSVPTCIGITYNL